MRKPTKWVALLLAFMMMSALFVGCAKSDVSESASTSSGASSQVSSGEASTSTETEPEKPEKLTIWIQKTFSDDFNNAYAALFEEFGEQNGIEVDAQVIDAAALRDTKLPAALESGDMPNISYMEPASLVAYAKQGIIVSAEDALAELAANGTEFYDSLLDATKVDGVSYAVPFSAQSWMLWYRTDMLEAAGFDGPPETWEEMLEMAIATTDASQGIYGAGFAAGAGASDFNNMAQSILWSYGGSVMRDGEINLDSPESQEALKLLLSFFQEGAVAPDMIAGDDMANNTAMLSGSACFIVNIPTIAGALQSDAPDIWAVTGCSPLPAGPEGSFPLAAVNMMSILDNGESENYWAAKALAYAVDETRLGTVLELVAPAYGMAYADTLDNAEYMSDPVVAALMTAISTGKYYNYPDPEFTLERSLLTSSSTFINNIISYVMVDGMSFEDALAKEIELCEQALAAAQ